MGRIIPYIMEKNVPNHQPDGISMVLFRGCLLLGRDLNMLEVWKSWNHMSLEMFHYTCAVIPGRKHVLLPGNEKTSWTGDTTPTKFCEYHDYHGSLNQPNMVYRDLTDSNNYSNPEKDANKLDNWKNMVSSNYRHGNTVLFGSFCGLL